MNDKIYVWDRFVRFFHWSLVGLFAFSYLSAEENTTLHSYSGYAIAALVLARLAWGFFGTRFARFREFVRGPKTVLAYAREYLGGAPRRYLGHNPLGGAMVLALLLSLGATTLSGMQLLALEEGKGPFAVMPASSLSPVATAVADDEELERSGHRDAGHGDGEELWEEIHEIAVNLTLALIALHIAGVLVSGRMHRESLVRAMLTGYKRRQDSA